MKIAVVDLRTLCPVGLPVVHAYHKLELKGEDFAKKLQKDGQGSRGRAL